MRSDRGLSIVELILAMLVVATTVAAVLATLEPGRTWTRVEPEAADLQQRLRVAYQALHDDLLLAGGGPLRSRRALSGALSYYLPAILPFAHGGSDDDVRGTARTDRMTVLRVPATSAVATTTADATVGRSGATLFVALERPCGLDRPLCGFTAGMTVLIFDGTGAYEVARVTAVDAVAGSLIIEPPAHAIGETLRAGSTLVEVIARVYALKIDRLTGVSQLIQHDASTGSDLPLVDHVVNLAFEYYGDPRPPAVVKPLDAPVGPWTTYGPKPPPADRVSDGGHFPPGENCVFQVDAPSARPVSRLATLGTDVSSPVVPLTSVQMSDGPWCPDATSAHRWDADLLRIRRVVVRLRVEAADDALRGPAGLWFSRRGTASGAGRWVPDREIRFQVAPRNLNGGR